MAAATILNCEKVAIALLFDQYLPNLVGMLQPQYRTHLLCRKITQLPKVERAAILDFEIVLSIYYLLTNPHQIWWDWCDSDVMSSTIAVEMFMCMLLDHKIMVECRGKLVL